jgi:transcriptional regulator with XRE-family HTH domain
MSPLPDKTTDEYRRLVAQEALIADAQELVCELLESAHMSRQELAAALGKSKGFVSQLLSGERNMTLRTLADLAYATGYRLELRAMSEEAPKQYRQVVTRPPWYMRAPTEVDQFYKVALMPFVAQEGDEPSNLAAVSSASFRYAMPAQCHETDVGDWIRS